MGRVFRLTAVAICITAMSACSKPEPVHDVAFFKDQPDMRAATLVACRNDRGRLAATSDCINALAADGAAVSKRFWTTSPVAPRVREPGKL